MYALRKLRAFLFEESNMLEKDPTTYALLTYLWVGALSMAGGLVAFIRRLNKAKEPQPIYMIFLKLLGELIVSGFTGVVTFYLCEHLETQALLTAVLVAVSGHMGGNAIDLLTKEVEKLTNVKLTKKDDEVM